MPIRKFSAAEAFETYRNNPFSGWPRRDDPDNRFAHFADPAFQPRFMLTPGQRIFTIGSCFAREIDLVLADRGFDVPTVAMLKGREWGGEPHGVLNNYVPTAIAPQIRWAFELDEFSLDKHCVPLHGRHVDLHLPTGYRPWPAAEVLKRRENISAIYRELAGSNVVVITLGLIEAWFDHRSNCYINCTPPKGAVKADPARFELHILEYNDVLQSLRDLTALLTQVCPRDYRMILTISPVPLSATFSPSDVAVANTYSKAVLRAAAEALIAEHGHIEYFPSYESVILTDRSLAMVEDQVHVHHPLVRFNVDRMIRRYVNAGQTDSVAEIIERARAERKAGRAGVAFKQLQAAWTANPDEPKLGIALADAHFKAGHTKIAEQLLLKQAASAKPASAHSMLARQYNLSGRHEEAAFHAEKASENREPRLNVLLERATAYWHLRRFEEGLAVLGKVQYAMERRSEVMFWRARCLEGLGRWDEAERAFKECNEIADLAIYKWAYAKFLAGRGRWDEARAWIDRAVIGAPEDSAMLRLRSELMMMRLRADVKFGKTGVGRRARGMVRGALDRLRGRRPAYGTEQT